MMTAVVGSILKVKGSRSATPDNYPIPGIAPTIRPMMAPAVAAKRFWVLIAVASPPSNKLKFSISYSPLSELFNSWELDVFTTDIRTGPKEMEPAARRQK